MRNAVLIGGEERVVPLSQVLALWKESVELGVDNLGNLRRKRFGEIVQRLAESEELDMQCGVGSVNRMGGHETLQREDIFV